MTGSVWAALLLSTIAGLSTAIGSVIALFSKKDDTRFLSISLGFSAGVMITVSFAELLPEAKEKITSVNPDYGLLLSVVFLIVGIIISAAIECIIPSPDSISRRRRKNMGKPAINPMLRMGIVTAVAITIHNFPEGIATFMAGYSDLRIGLPVAFSIAMHNIPEGIAVAVPLFYGTGSRAKAFGFSALSGLSEPIGALAAYLFLAPFLNEGTLGAIFAVVAGIMIYIAFAELVPASEKYSRPRCAVGGILGGAVAMLFIMVMFA